MNKIDFAAKRKTVTVEIPELEATFTLRALSVNQVRGQKEETIDDTIQELAMAIVDEDGQRIYTTAEDLANLSEMSVTVLKKFVEALKDLHGLSKKSADETVKN